MTKKTKWKIIAAVLAIAMAGTVYCIFFTEEKEEAVLYWSDKTNADTGFDVFAPDAGDGSAQTVNKADSVGQGGAQLPEKTDTPKENPDLIYVHVCGAVKKPGVYSLVRNSRVCDAIVLAGGLTETAADDYVNQARFLNDGERVYIPEIEELSSLSPAQYAAGQPVNVSLNENDVQSGRQQPVPVNINTASVSELTTLPGIGTSRAESIIDYREQYGAFTNVEDIMKISGIKGAAYEKIKDRICTGNE